MKDKILKAIFPIFVCAQIAFSVFSYFNGTETRDLLYNFFISIILMLSFIIAQIAKTCTQFLMIKRIEHRLIINLLTPFKGTRAMKNSRKIKIQKAKMKKNRSYASSVAILRHQKIY